MLRLITTLILIAPLTVSIAGQQTVPLANQHFDVFEVTPAEPAYAFSVTVTSADQLVIDVVTHDRPLIVQIHRPDGSVVDASLLRQFLITTENTPPLGAILFDAGHHVQLDVGSPMDGIWIVEVSLPAGSPITAGTITTIATGGLQVGVTTSRLHYVVGQPVVVVVPAFLGSVPVTGASANAEIFSGGSTNAVRALTLRDDGSSPDIQAGDGLYTASATGLVPGDYLIRARVDTNGQIAVAGTSFNVTEVLGQFDGSFADSGVDTNGDGLFERIDLEIGVNISSAGTYQVVGELGLGDDKRIRSGTRVDLAEGASTVTIPFNADALKTYLAGDGPWHIKKIQMVRLPDSVGDRRQLADHRLNLGLTGAYSLDQLQRPVTLVRDGLTDTGVDTDGNELYDRLDVRFKIDTLSSGFYTWTGNLKAADGTVIAIASDRGSLPVGVTEVSFSFDGQTIGEKSIDGPYTVGNIAVYGPPGAATVREQLGETAHYLASEFEGGAVTFANLIRQVENLVLTGIGGKPRAEGIRTSLLRKLQNAQAKYDRGQTKPALNQLGAFVNQLEAQTGKHIATEDAERLIVLTEQLMAAL